MGELKLKREISGLTAFTVVVGTVIGAGVFFKPTAVYSAAGSASTGLLAWLVGGIIALAGGLTVAEIGTLIPETGGITIFIERMYGKPMGFLVGWAQMIVYFPGNIAALVIIFATQAINLLGLDKSLVIPIAIVTVCLLTLINGLGNRATGALQNVATAMKLIPLSVLIIAGLFFNPHPIKVELWPQISESTSFLTSFGTSLMATLFAYDGWMNISALAGELKNPRRDLPRAIIGGLSLVTSVYLLINLAYLQVMSAGDLGATVTPAADVAALLFPGFGGKFVTIGILVSVFGGTNGYMMSAWRVPYSLGVSQSLPFSTWFARLNSKTKMPVNSGLFILLISLGMILTGTFDQLTDLSIFVIWIFNTLTFLGIFKLRRESKGEVDSYRVPLYPFIPLVAIIGGTFILLTTLLTQTSNALLGIFLTLLGLPLFFYHQRHQGKQQAK